MWKGEERAWIEDDRDEDGGERGAEICSIASRKNGEVSIPVKLYWFVTPELSAVAK